MQYAVNADTDAKVFLVNLEVNIRGPLLQRLKEDQIDNLNDLRFLGKMDEVLRVPYDFYHAHLFQGKLTVAHVGDEFL